MNNNDIISKNMNLVYFTIKKYFPNYIGDKDIVQAGTVGLHKAVSSHDANKSKFSSWAIRCIYNEIATECRRRLEHGTNISITSLDAIDEECGDFTNVLEDEGGYEEAELRIYLEQFAETLSGRQREIFNELLNGSSPKELANDYGCSPRSVYRQVKKIKEKYVEWKKL